MKTSIDALREASEDVNYRPRYRNGQEESRMASKSKSPDVAYGERLGIRGLRKSQVVRELSKNAVEGRIGTLRSSGRVQSPKNNFNISSY